MDASKKIRISSYVSDFGIGRCSSVSNNSSSLEQPIDHLIRLVSSMSRKALAASTREIQAVMSMVDRMAGSLPTAESKFKLVHDLAAMSRSGPYVSRTMKRKIDALTTDTCNSEFDSSHCIKRQRVETLLTVQVLLEEIREINQRLIDTVVDVVGEDKSKADSAESRGGTIVQCSFCVLGTSPYLNSKKCLIKPLQLLIPENYPDCSPILLNKSEEDDDLSVKVQEKLNRFLRTFCQPMSLAEIAKAWGNCVREVFCEYVEQHGGGTFTSKYRGWDNFLSSS